MALTAGSGGRTARSWAWVGIMPFLAFALLFLILPTMQIVVGAFRNPEGAFTLQNIANLFTPAILGSFWNLDPHQLRFGVPRLRDRLGDLTWAVTLGELPAMAARAGAITFSGVASNFAGVPLAFAFIVTLGRVGLITVLLRDLFGINLYRTGFNLYTFGGLCLVYLYFQFPLMMLIMAPALTA